MANIYYYTQNGEPSNAPDTGGRLLRPAQTNRPETPRQTWFDVLPSHRRFAVDRASTLLEILAAAGVGVGGTCGGKGWCGRCRVRWITPAPAESVQDLRWLSARERAQGWRLACAHSPQAFDRLWVPHADSALWPLSLPSVSDLILNPLVRRDPLPHSENDLLSTADARRDALRTLGVPPTETASDKIAQLPSEIPLLFVHTDHATLDLHSAESPPPIRGLAVDIGTSTITMHWVDLLSGRLCGSWGLLNPQQGYGADVISRIEIAGREGARGLHLLQRVLIEALVQGVEAAADELGIAGSSVMHAAFVGNPTMLHLLLGESPETLGRSPFRPRWYGRREFPARVLGLPFHPEAQVTVLPLVSGFVGADAVAAMLAAGIDRKAQPALMIDFGTNGEIVLAQAGKLFATSAAAGPAFEGSGISCGMPALPGAVHRVGMEDGWTVEVLGEQTARGICGTGLIDLTARLLETGALRPDGRFVRDHPLVDGGRVPIAPDVFLSQHDARQIQLAVGAIRTGILGLMESAGLSPPQIVRVVLAGHFGTRVDVASLCRLGILDPEWIPRTELVSCAAGQGAIRALLNRQVAEEADRLAQDAVSISLASLPNFRARFVEALRFPEPDVGCVRPSWRKEPR